MSIKKKNPSFASLLVVVFSLAFALVGIAVFYQAASTTTDDRSKAAEAPSTVTYRSWEFAGATTEGWQAVKGSRLTLKDGALVVAMTTGSVLPVIEADFAKVVLPKGKKTISFSVQFPKILKANSPDQTKRNFTGKLYYQKAGAKTYELPVIFRGQVDTGVQTVSVALPDADDLTLSKLRIAFESGMTSSETMYIDWIRIYVEPVRLPNTPTPTAKGPINITPTPTACLNGVVSTAVAVTTCPEGQTTQLGYICKNGASGQVGDGSCQDITLLEGQAKAACYAQACMTTTPIQVVVCAPEDLNNDGSVNQLDLSIMIHDMDATTTVFNSKSDINRDGLRNTLDYNMIVAKLNSSTGGCRAS